MAQGLWPGRRGSHVYLLSEFWERYEGDPRYEILEPVNLASEILQFRVAILQQEGLTESEKDTLKKDIARLVAEAGTYAAAWMDANKNNDLTKMSEAAEGLARIRGTIELGQQLLEKGWKIHRLGVPIPEVGLPESQIDVIATKNIYLDNYKEDVPVTTFTMIEPYLDSTEVNEFSMKIENAASWVKNRSWYEYMGSVRVLVIIIENADAGAVDRLIQELKNKPLLGNVMVIYNGQVVYYSGDQITQQDAERICQEIGKCGADADPPDPDGEGYTIYAPPPLNPDGSPCTQPPCILSAPLEPVPYGE